MTQQAASFTVAKSTAELYKIRSNGFAWADVTIDARGHAGRISIASDYGDWQYYWSHCGCPFREFLAQIDAHYAAGKFGASKWIDTAKTITNYKRELLEAFRQECLTKREAREVFDQIKALEEESTPESISHDLRLYDELVSFLVDGGGPDFSYSIEPGFQHFWKELWPVLLAEFAREAEPVAA